jgi:hypothetical protein
MTPKALADELEDSRAQAILTRDWKVLSELLSDNLYFAHSSGLIDDKKSLLQKFQDGKIVYRSVQTTLTDARLLTDDVLQAAGSLALVAEIAGATRTVEAIYMVVWIRGEEGKWRLSGHQSTAKPL